MLIFRSLRKAAPYDCINKIFEGMSHRYHRNTQIIVFPFQTKTLKTRFCCLWASPTRFQFVCQWMQARLASLPHESKTAFGLNNISEKPRCRLTPSCVCYSLDSWNSCVPLVLSVATLRESDKVERQASRARALVQTKKHLLSGTATTVISMCKTKNGRDAESLRCSHPFY